MSRSKPKLKRHKLNREENKEAEGRRSVYSGSRDGINFMRERKLPTKQELLNKKKHKQFDYDD